MNNPTNLRAQEGPYFGEYGGRFVPESLIAALDELDATYKQAKADPSFAAELAELNHSYVGRPSIITEVPKFAALAGDIRVFLKREDLNHTGSHKINNVMGQALLAKRMGKKRIIAETGAGQHGVATATIAARLGLECHVFMGVDDIQRQSANVFRMKMLGANVVGVTSGSRTLKDALNEALRDWATNVDSTYYIIGTVAGPHPYPMLVRDFQSVIGREVKQQSMQQLGRLPDSLVACVGGGSNAIGLFYPFIDDKQVRMKFLRKGSTVTTGSFSTRSEMKYSGFVISPTPPLPSWHLGW